MKSPIPKKNNKGKAAGKNSRDINIRGKLGNYNKLTGPGNKTLKPSKIPSVNSNQGGDDLWDVNQTIQQSIVDNNNNNSYYNQYAKS